MSARAAERAGRAPERPASPSRLLRPPPATPGNALRLDPEQRQVVEHRGGPLLVLAGPGTGKTATLVEAVLDRTQGPNALRPDEILILTFSRAARPVPGAGITRRPAAPALRSRAGRGHPRTGPRHRGAGKLGRAPRRLAD